MKILSVKASKLLRLAALSGLLAAGRCLAYDTVWTGAGGNNDFFNPANWSVLVPTNDNSLNISGNGTALVDTNSTFNTSGTDVYMNYADVGDAFGGASSTIQGNLIINNGTNHLAESSGNLFWAIGFNTNGYSTFVVNGGTVLYDNPSAVSGALWKLHPGSSSSPPGISGENGLVFNCGNAGSSGGTAFGRLELHSNALMRVAHAINMGNGGATTNATTAYPEVLSSGVLVMDGNSELDIGDGFGLGQDLGSNYVALSGNANLVVGNSMGIGNANGSSQQGYITLGARLSTRLNVVVQDNAQINCMSLQSRAPATILVTNNAQFNVFNVLGGSGTVTIPFQSAYLAGVDATATNALFGEQTNVVFTVADHGRFYVDTLGEFGTGTTPVAWSNAVNGLVIGNGLFSTSINGGAPYGSTGVLIIKDYGTLDIRQSLTMGTAHDGSSNPANSRGTLQVVGPNATVTIGGNLCLTIGFVTNAVFVPTNTTPAGAVGCISAAITGPTHSTIIVSNSAYINHQGTLQVQLSGYTPVGGETYTLIRNINGTNDGVFATNDFSAAPLSPGLVWQVSNTSTTVVLQVVNTFNLQKLGANLNAVWTNETGFGTNLLFTNILQSSTSAASGYTDIVPTATSPYTINPTSAARFFRLRH